MIKHIFTLTILLAAAGCASHSSYTSYQGPQQTWPTGSAPRSQTHEQLPVYHGLPEKPYMVVGTAPLPEGPAMETDAVELAQQNGGEAVLVLDQEGELASALRLAAQNPEPTSHPLTFKNANAGFVVEDKSGLPITASAVSSGKVAVVIRWSR